MVALSPVSTLPYPIRLAPLRRRRAAAARPEPFGVRLPLRPALAEDLFRSVLLRERHCADRFGRPIALFLLSSDRALPGGTGWRRLLEALRASTRETDVVGWFSRDSVIGVVVPDLEADEAEAAAAAIEARLRSALAARVGATALAGISLRRHVYSHPSVLQSDEVWPAEPVAGGAFEEHRRTTFEVFKRALDIAGSALLLALLSPLMLAVAVLIKVKSPGPVLFRQERVGQRGRRFIVLKFRTMLANADDSLHQAFAADFIAGGGEFTAPNGERLFKRPNDPRVTPFGRMLRRTSLDELPQLWNVLRGDMSMVGPRPPIPYEVERYQPWHWRRVMEAKPGLTGLWQVEGRSRTNFDGMVRLDLRYVRTRSFANDLRILLATPRAVITGKGAC